MRFDKYMMAQMNRKLLLELLFLHGPINRAELAKLSGLSIPTVMKLLMHSRKKTLSELWESVNPLAVGNRNYMRLQRMLIIASGWILAAIVPKLWLQIWQGKSVSGVHCLPEIPCLRRC